MAFLQDLSAALQLVCLLAAAAATVQLNEEDCPPSSDLTPVDALAEAICTFHSSSDEASAFRKETRLLHEGGDKQDAENTITLASFFNPFPAHARCGSSCEGIGRDNVTWCVRLADVNKTIETCVFLGDDQQLVFRSTCDAQSLDLGSYLSLPTKEECNSAFPTPLPAGCLGLTNINWYFKDAYLTCISENDTCRDVSFSAIFKFGASGRAPPSIQITPSLLKVQPSEQIVIHAEVTTSEVTTYISWHHENTTYNKHILEDPFCDESREGACGNLSSYNADQKNERIHSYRIDRAHERCQGSKINVVEIYLIIDNATESDAGTYDVQATTQYIGLPITDMEQVNIIVECDETLFYEATCSNLVVTTYKTNNTEWRCSFKAPGSGTVSVIHNKTAPALHTDLAGKDSLEIICSTKEPQVMYDVEEEEQHVCYSKYTVRVVMCSSVEDSAGDYHVVWGQGNEVEKSNVKVKVTNPVTKPSVEKDALQAGRKNNVSAAAYTVPVVFFLVVALVGVMIVLVVLIRRRKRKRAQGHLSQLQSPDPTATAPEAVFYKKSGQFSPVSLLSPQSVSAAYSDPLEFPRNRLYIYTNKVLGEGSFGRVLQAKAQGIVPDMPDRNLVALKTTKENATSVEIEELLGELDLMRNMKPHENILNLLGQCTTPGGPVCLIVEYARYGNLRDFLRQCEEVVLSLNHKPHIPRTRSRTGTFSTSSVGSTRPLILRQDSSVFTPGSGHHQFVFPFPSPPSRGRNSSSSSSTVDSKHTAHHPSTAVPLAHSVAPIGHDYINSKGLVYMEDVHNFAIQIACGLQHLANMQIVHCDLAARNVLIAEGFVLKIADFGMARDISGREMYKKNPRGKIPVKWTAPEALENRIFTIKSDIWSYGVVLWELFTYGHTPYPDVHLGHSYEAIISYLKQGNRMAQPDSCSDSFYELMQKCWALDPDDRPTPVDIVACLTPLDGRCQDDNTDIQELSEEDCKSNGMKENGNHHSIEN